MLAWLLVAALAIGLATYAFSYPLNHDVGWYVYLAQEALGGEDFSTAFIETNPPLIIYLSMFPAYLASALGQPVAVVTKVLVLSLTLFIAGGTTVLVSKAGGPRWILPAVCAAILVSVLGLPGTDLGQREHLLVCLTLPYLALVWLRLADVEFDAGPPVGIAIGALAAIGFALKPHFVLIWLAIELWFGIRTSRRFRAIIRPESVTVMVVGGLCLVFTIVGHVESLAAMWELRSLYGRFNAQPRTGLIANIVFLALLCGTFIGARGSGALIGLTRLLLVFSWGAFIVMVLQGKGFAYHIYPVIASLVIALPVLGIAYWLNWPSSSRRLAGVELAVVGCLLLLTLVSISVQWVEFHQAEREDRNRQIARLLPVFENVPEGAFVLVLSDHVDAGFPVVTMTGVRWASPFPSLWWIKALYAHEEGAVRIASPEAMDSVEAMLARSLVRRIEQVDPELVLVDISQKRYYDGRAFPYDQYLTQFESFEKEWSRYTSGELVGPFRVLRRDGIARAP